MIGEKIGNTINQKLSEFSPLTSPNSNKDIKIILVDIYNKDYHLKGIQSSLHYVRQDDNLDDLVRLINQELIEQENKLLGEKIVLIRREFAKDICKVLGVKKTYRATCILPLHEGKKGYPIFGYASIAIK